jgi:glucosamine kinase
VSTAGRLYLGVDGGGTRTRARVRDESGANLGEAEAGPGNFHLGDRAWAEVMRASFAALASADASTRDHGRVHAGFGLAGTQPAADRAAAMARPHPFGSLVVDTDAYAACLGAFGGGDGAILILGTGSCGLALIGGKRRTVGGWGHHVGDDGSGMAIGRLAVRRSLWALEGMAALTPFVEAVLARFDRDPERMVAWAAAAIPADYASLAPLAFSHAERGDAVARAIVAESARDAAMLIDRLLALGAPKVAMVGGIFPLMRRWIPGRLQPFLIEPAADAADGAILMARGVPLGSREERQFRP